MIAIFVAFYNPFIWNYLCYFYPVKSSLIAGKGLCQFAKSSIKVNGKEYSLKRPGHNVVAINLTTGVPYRRRFFPSNRKKYAGVQLGKFISSLPPETIVAIAVQVK